MHYPQPPLSIESDAQQVAVAQRPDLRRHAALVGEGVVGRLAAVVVEAHQLAQVGLHVLRGIELLPLARRDPQLAVAAEQQAVAVVAAAADLGHLAPDHLRSEEHTSELQSLMRNAYAVFCLK